MMKMVLQMLFMLAVISCLSHVTSAGGSQRGATGTTGEFKFDCKQFGNDCDNPGNPCDPSTGVCDCFVSANYNWGYDCKEPSDNSLTLDLTTCTNCDQTGTILCVPGGTGACYCKETHYGTTCDKLRVSHTCTATTMSVSIQPFQSTFTGLVYLKGKKTSCPLTLTPPGPIVLTFADATCGSTALTTPVAAQQYEIVVQYNPDVKSDTDNVITATCPDGTSQSEVLTPVTKTVSEANIDDNLRSVSSDLPTGLTSSLTQDLSTGAALTGAVNIGDDIYFIITLAKATYNFMKLTDMTVSDGATTTPVTKTLVTGACFTSDAAQMVKDFGNTASTSDGRLWIKFGAFKIGATSDAIFTATVTVCQADPECARSACTAEVVKTATVRSDYQLGDASKETVSRRRRRAADDQNTSGTMSVNMRINSLEDAVTAVKDAVARGQAGTSLSCVQNLVFLLPLIIMAVMLLISMGMTLYFCLKITRDGGRSPEGNVNMAYKA